MVTKLEIYNLLEENATLFSRQDALTAFMKRGELRTAMKKRYPNKNEAPNEEVINEEIAGRYQKYLSFLNENRVPE